MSQYAALALKDLLNTLQGYQTSNNLGIVPVELQDEVLSKLNPEWARHALLDIGGESFVFSAFDALKRKVAIKIALPKLISGESKKDTFIFGLWRTKSKEHQVIEKERFKEGVKVHIELYRLLSKVGITTFYIPQVFDAKEQPWLYYVMEFVEAEKCLIRLKDKHDLIYSLNEFCKLLECVAFIHDHGVVHRDLKSDNILIGEKERIIVVDWTLSKIIGRDLTIPGVATQMGSYPYASPKVMGMQRAGEATYPDDIFSLGFIFVEFLIWTKLTRPLDLDLREEDDLKEYIKRCRGLLPQAITGVDLRAIYDRATAFNEEDRYQDCETFLKDVRAAMAVLQENNNKTFPATDVATRRVVIKKEKIFTVPANLCELCKYDCKCQACSKIIAALQQLKKEGIL